MFKKYFKQHNFQVEVENPLKTKFFNLEIFKEIRDDKFITRHRQTWLTYMHLQSIKFKSTQFLHHFGII
jgi:hypothetical protein